VQLILLVAASVCAAAKWKVGASELDVPSGIAAAAFLGALGLSLYRSSLQPDERWVRMRAAAEAVKTGAWRYAVCGEPYADSDEHPDGLLLEHIESTLATIEDQDLGDVPADAREITEWMRATRAKTFALRAQVYLHGRVGDQISYYTRRARQHTVGARLWGGLGAVANAAGVAAGVARFAGAFDVDLLGVFASIGAAAVAWTQLHQHRRLAVTYRQTARQLAIARDRAPTQDPTAWGEFVMSVEELLTREHLVWLATRERTNRR
jgi:hypothetical protein